jgi:hypothetical protein
MEMPNKLLMVLYNMTSVDLRYNPFSDMIEVTYWLRIGGGSKSIMLSQFELPKETAYVLQEALIYGNTFSVELRDRIERSITEKAAEHIAEFALDR